MRQGVVPDETGRRIRERVASAFASAAAGIAARPAGKFALDIIRGEAAVGPLVAVRAQDAGAVGVVEQRKFTDELVLVRRHAFAKDAQAGVAVAGLHVAEHLVITAVFLDD